jgi:hypothetical protein
LKEKVIPLSTIKWISESSKDVGDESVGFTCKDFIAIYGEKMMNIDDGMKYLGVIKDLMSKPFTNLSENEKNLLDKIGITAWDIIQANSGGHKCITNISGLNFFGRSKRPPEGKYSKPANSEDAAYVKFLKMLQKEFVNKLKEKIEESKG